MNEKRLSLNIYIDFFKAFDTVNHQILKQKLSHLGVKNNTLLWVDSYLYNRKQRTITNNVYSNYKTIQYGVPQGSILGLFADWRGNA